MSTSSRKDEDSVLNKITNAVERAGTEVVNQVSSLAEGQSAEVTEDAIQTAVDKALDVLRVAGDQVREKGMNAERVTLRAGVGIPNVAQLEISTDVPSKHEESRGKGFDVKLDNALS